MTPHVALAATRTFDDVVTTATQTSGLLSWLSVIFGALAAALAIVGIYSVMSYTVAQRTRELAIRSAVGASRSMLLGAVIREGFWLSVAGIVAGVVLALAGSGVLGALLYDVQATDPSRVRLVGVGPGDGRVGWIRHSRDARRPRRAGHGAARRLTESRDLVRW